MDFDRNMFLLFGLILVVAQIQLSYAIETDFTVEIEAGKRDCFYQHLKKDSNFELEYQVGNVSSNFKLTRSYSY